MAALSKTVDESIVLCMEEPENGIHPAKLNAMNRLLHDVAVDPKEAVAPDNPLRQVIVVTHSPYFIQLQNRNDLVLAENSAMRSPAGNIIFLLKCYPLQGSWRERSGNDGERQSPGVGKLNLQSYLQISSEYVQLSFPTTCEEVQ
ncbi:AAA family ATPase [Candidatus Synechococcus spongiarum]|uniref:AAA family ATPase n=1 Tax=Candidatus Synechococcus spongiarum TaxID=431041 RepID=UPI0015D66869